MALSSATTWSNTTEILAHTGPCRLTAVEIDLLPTASAASFFQAWDSADPTPGTTAPDVQVRIHLPTVRPGSRQKIVFPKGMRMADGLAWFVSTASAGGTAATTHAPGRVTVYYVTGN